MSEQATQTQTEAIQQKEYLDQQQALSIELTAKAEKLKGSRQGQCVVAVRNFLGVGRDEIQGAAKTTKINSHDPEVGSIIIFRMSSWGHVGVVLFTTEDRIYYYDSNGDWRQRAAIRSVAVADQRIRGFHQIK